MVSIKEKIMSLVLTGDAGEISALSRSLRYRPEGFWRSDKYAVYKMTDGADGWDGYISPISFNHDAQVHTCLRGHLDDILASARKLGIQTTPNLIKRPFGTITVDDVPNGLITADYDLDYDQRTCIVEWLRHGIGLNKVAVNGGKTALFAGVAAMVKRSYPDFRTIYITHSERLICQAYAEMKKFLPDWNITQYGGGTKDNTGTDLVICGNAMLWKNREKLLAEEFFKTFQMILYDESHHACSPSSKKILLAIPAVFRFGSSDTQKIKDPGKLAVLKGLLGPIRNTVTDAGLIEKGRSAKPHIYIVDEKNWTGRYDLVGQTPLTDSVAFALVGKRWVQGYYVGPVFERDNKGNLKMRKKKILVGSEFSEKKDHEVGKWEVVEEPIVVEGHHHLNIDGEDMAVASEYCILDRMTDTSIVKFKERNERIVEWTDYYANKLNKRTLIVCTRTVHVLILQALIKKVVDPEKVRILFSKHTGKQRDECFEWWKSTPGSVVISPLVQEGVSINEIEAGVVADYVADWERAKQIIGRFVRQKKEGANEAFITMFIENQHFGLRRGSRRVLKNLMEIRGYEFYWPCNRPKDIKAKQKYLDLSL